MGFLRHRNVDDTVEFALLLELTNAVYCMLGSGAGVNAKSKDHARLHGLHCQLQIWFRGRWFVGFGLLLEDDSTRVDNHGERL